MRSITKWSFLPVPCSCKFNLPLSSELLQDYAAKNGDKMDDKQVWKKGPCQIQPRIHLIIENLILLSCTLVANRTGINQWIYLQQCGVGLIIEFSERHQSRVIRLMPERYTSDELDESSQRDIIASFIHSAIKETFVSHQRKWDLWWNLVQLSRKVLI